MKRRLLIVVVFLLAVAGSAHAGVMEFIEKEKWIAAVGDFTTIGFTGFVDGEFITEQYADIGVHFTDGNDTFFFSPGFLNDSWGVDGSGPSTFVFDTPPA